MTPAKTMGDIFREAVERIQNGPAPTPCPYCNGTGTGSYWVHSLEYTIDAECHICGGSGTTDEAGHARGREDAARDSEPTDTEATL